jgi:hypothetical protein
MKILFYLPAVTDRNFDSIVLPLLRIAVRAGEVHVAGPPQWEAAGLSEHQLGRCADLPEIQWHVFDGADHPSLRTAPSNPQELVDYVAEVIAPDITLCRSADTATPAQFPGTTRFLMEPVFMPFIPRPGGGVFLDGPRIFDQGFVPDLAPDDAERLDALFAPRWAARRAALAERAGTRADWCAAAGLPVDKRIVALPLSAEAPNNFFIRQHCIAPPNLALVEQIADQLDPDCVLALTRHPLNIRDGVDEPLAPLLERLGGRAMLVSDPGPLGHATTSLIAHADGLVVGDTKAFSIAAFFGKPIYRISRYACAPWLSEYRAFDAFQADLLAGRARIAEEAGMRRWFGYHVMNNMFDAQDPALTPQELVARSMRRVVPECWEAGLVRLAH